MIKYSIPQSELDSTIQEQDSVIIQSDLIETNCSDDIQDIYKPILPSEIDIFRDIDSEIRKITLDSVKNQVSSFIRIFKIYYYRRLDVINIDNVLSKLHLSCGADVCIVEWIFETFRIGISFEKDEDESSYYIIEQQIETGEINSHSRLLKGMDYTIVIDKIINYVLSNT